MTLGLVFSKMIVIEGLDPYDIVLCSDGQIVLQKTFPDLDMFGSEIPPTCYAPTKQPILGAQVYRKAVREIVNFIHNRRIPYFWFSTDGEAKRVPLYDRFAKTLAKSPQFTYVREEGAVGYVVHHFYRNKHPSR